MDHSQTIHASAVLFGARAVLIRGASGTGKSRLALALIQAGESGILPFTRLVGDDRVHVEAVHGRLLGRPADTLKGLLEVRGVGIRRVSFEPMALIGLVVDLGAAEADRLPAPAAAATEIVGIMLPRLGVAACADPLSLLFAALRTAESRP